MRTIDPRKTVGEIARTHPECNRIFAKYGIDLCCGGTKPLETAAKAHGLDLDAILREIEVALSVTR